jgi:hypothetical protein
MSAPSVQRLKSFFPGAQRVASIVIIFTMERA